MISNILSGFLAFELVSLHRHNHLSWSNYTFSLGSRGLGTNIRNGFTTNLREDMERSVRSHDVGWPLHALMFMFELGRWLPLIHLRQPLDYSTFGHHYPIHLWGTVHVTLELAEAGIKCLLGIHLAYPHAGVQYWFRRRCGFESREAKREWRAKQVLASSLFWGEK